MKRLFMLILVIFICACYYNQCFAERPGSLVKDLGVKRSGWEPWKEGGAEADFEFTGSGIVIRIFNTIGAHNHIQLYQHGIQLKKDKKYILAIDVSSDKACDLIVMIHKPYRDWSSYQVPSDLLFHLKPGDNLMDDSFTYIDPGPQPGRITLYFGQISPKAKLLIKSVKLYEATN